MAGSEVVVKLSLDSRQFEADLKRVQRTTRRALNVPAWCYSPWRRGFVVAHAVAAPLLVILYAVTR